MGALLPAAMSAPVRDIARRTQRGRASTLPVTEEIDVLYITPEERATLQLLADGQEANEIAVRLRVPESQIDDLLTTLFESLGATSRTEAVSAAARRGLVVVDPALPAPTALVDIRRVAEGLRNRLDSV